MINWTALWWRAFRISIFGTNWQWLNMWSASSSALPHNKHISEVGQLALPLSTIIFLCCVQVLFVWFLRIILRCFPSRGKSQYR